MKTRNNHYFMIKHKIHHHRSSINHVFFYLKFLIYFCIMETFNITLPTSWAELSNAEWVYLNHSFSFLNFVHL